jgi:hypothetical protein
MSNELAPAGDARDTDINKKDKNEIKHKKRRAFLKNVNSPAKSDG